MSVGENIDIGKLERELASALEADKKYSRENDAKLRAVHQKVQTYEEFREIVQASHLVPLDRKDLSGSSARNQPWNTAAHGNTGGGVATTIPDVIQPSERIKNVQDFTREWRKLKKHTPQEQYQFLVAVGGAQLYNLFKVEISMGLLGEFVVILDQCFEERDCNCLLLILQQLSRTSRFSLSLSFLNQKERDAVTSLMRKLDTCTTASTDTTCTERPLTVRELGRCYGVSTV